MAERKCYIPNQLLDLDQIQLEAQHRWLRPAEICEILRNYQKFQLSTSPPSRPPAGSLFLFDRKVHRYFRKDGHRWRKKKDGKTVKEAHEKLKSGSVDVLHCYYAHGEDNDNFQRRSYWMLDVEFENIVLVHYREVKEGYRSGHYRLQYANSGLLLRGSQSGLSPSFDQTTSLDQKLQTSYASDPYSVDPNEQTVSSRLGNDDSLGTFSLEPSTDDGLPRDNSFYAPQTAGFLERDSFVSGFPTVNFDPDSSSRKWTGDGTFGNTSSTLEPNVYFDQKNTADFLSYLGSDTNLDADRNFQDLLLPYSQGLVQVHLGPQEMDTSVLNSDTQVSDLRNDEAGKLNKLDSFGRWMDKELGGVCEDSLMASDSGTYWNSNNRNEVSGLSLQMQLNTNSVGPSVPQEHLFTIHDFAPDWAYIGAEMKVLITGTFFGDKSGSIKWGCMFGDVEVPAEVVTESVIRCQVPSHAAGRVHFYITCSNRLACSEVREFQFLENPSRVVNSSAGRIVAGDEFSFLIRLTKLLWSRKWSGCSVANCENCKLKDMICSLESDKERSWGRITAGDKGNFKELLIQNLLKDKLYGWLLCEAHEEYRGLRTLDGKGQGVIHLAAALGYEWAVAPIAATCVGLNFRDTRGRTALHWASLYGREEMVVALIRLGAFAGAVDDPTPLNPGGQTAADLASSKGHKGIAGYLAEADLTSHPSALSLVDGNTARNAADEDHSLKGYLAAVKNSTHAAALIQDAFRVRSFRDKQLNKTNVDGFSESHGLATLGSLHNIHKTSHFDDYLHSAASKIQHKYRGWKGRNDFLKIRDRVVKIQAHFRVHQVRDCYKKIVWSVGIVEKVILRWRRRSHGLRGFHLERAGDKSDEYDFLQIGRKQKEAGVEKALARVQSMARHSEARDQYMRLVSSFEKSSR